MSHKSKNKYYQEPLFEELRKDTCYVCYDRIKKDEGIYIGNSLWRHKKCKPGGHNWLKSKIGQTEKSERLFGSETS
ncbi:MAG: hypothetical protein C0392_12640 [Syntrophus sp. (in: bacteria)]|nr:hypothetical protein [Syntrophus sp. (in: bacteria)]